MVNWAATIGPNTAQLFERILADKPHPEMGYRGCLGIIRLAKQYSALRVESAARLAIHTGACRYKSIQSILKNALDLQPLPERRMIPARARRTTTCAARSTSAEEKLMLQQPMIEKLRAMRLHGMAEALKAQEQDDAARELSFPDRLGMLIDRQWTWRQNQALARRLKGAKLRGDSAVEDIDYRAARGLDKSVIRALTQESVWVRNHENLFVLGPTGVGKSFVASALTQKACRDGYSAWYTRATSLFRELALARADGSLRTLLSKDRAHQRTGGRRLGHGAPQRERTSRLLGDLRRSLPDAIHRVDIASPGREMARADRRSHARRRHPRPAGA